MLGLLYAGILYWKDKRFEEVGKWLPILLALLRFIAVSGLATLLLSPLLRHEKEEIKQPSVIVLHDQSESIAANYSAEEIGSINSSLSELKSTVGEKFDLVELNFGGEIFLENDTSSINNKVTNLSKALEYVSDSYNDQNLGALVLISDGIYNEGKNPLYQNLKFKAPLYTVAVGDTTVKRDLQVSQVYHNKIAYLGDKFGIQVDIQAKNAQGSRSRLRLQKNVNNTWTTIREEAISISKNDFFETRNLDISADVAGVNRYRIALTQIQDESTTANNIKDIYIEVLDAKQKFLVLANAPNPDLAAIKQLLETNKNYEIEIKYKDESINIVDYDFVIFHNLPSSGFNIQPILDRLNQRKTPRLFVVGEQTNLNAFNRVQDVLNIAGKGSSSNEVQAILTNNFSLFKLDDKTKSSIDQFVPVRAPFAEYKEGPKSNTLLYQKIGKISTKYPLLSFSEQNGIKTAVFAGEGIWRWKLFDYLQHENFDIIKDLMAKTITYTSVKEDKRKFRVSTSENIYKENERIFFDAELYNNSYQLVNEPDVFLTLTKDGNEEFKYTFSKRDDTYSLDAGILPEGSYNYKADVNYEGKVLSQTGFFSVQSIQLELYKLTADHNLLNSLSNKYGGQLFLPEQINDLESLLTSSDNIKPVMYLSSTTNSVIHYKWLFFVLLSLIGVEWFLRRYFGSY